MYPKLEINIKKIQENAAVALDLCKQNSISCFLVTKVLAGDVKIVSQLSKLGFTHLADSRLKNLKKFKNLTLPKVLLRSPMKHEIKDLLNYADVSLESELSTIKNINAYAKKYKKNHDIILMFDLGDLREGIFIEDDYIAVVQEILSLDHINLLGIGTNLTCYGGIIPTHEHLDCLRGIKTQLESYFNIIIPLISAGNSSLIYLLEQNLPLEINNIRLGEAIYFGHETSFHQAIKAMHQDIFILKAELIEVKIKPSLPQGQRGFNAFREVLPIKDQGLMKRGILALGKQDINEKDIFPLDNNVHIIGASSDHLILDLTKTTYKIGDTISFKLNYSSLLSLMNSKYVKKTYNL